MPGLCPPALHALGGIVMASSGPAGFAYQKPEVFAPIIEILNGSATTTAYGNAGPNAGGGFPVSGNCLDPITRADQSMNLQIISGSLAADGNGQVVLNQ